MVPWVVLQFVIVVFSYHIHLLFIASNPIFLPACLATKTSYNIVFFLKQVEILYFAKIV